MRFIGNAECRQSRFPKLGGANNPRTVCFFIHFQIFNLTSLDTRRDENSARGIGAQSRSIDTHHWYNRAVACNLLFICQSFSDRSRNGSQGGSIVKKHGFIVFIALFSLWHNEFTVILAQEVTESEKVVVIEVPVQILKGGKPLRGLEKKNFRILDNGEPQEITSFRAVDLEDPGQMDDEAYAGDFTRQRHFLVVFDLFFASIPNINRAKKAVIDLLYDGMNFEDKMSINIYVPNRGLTMLTGFTNDEIKVETALDGLDFFTDPRQYKDAIRDQNRESESAARRDPYWYEDRLYIGEGRDIGLKLETRLAFAKDKLKIRRVGDVASSSLKERLDKLAHFKNVGSPRPDSNSLVGLINDLGQTASALRHLEGGKYVIYLSEGFPNSMIGGGRFSEMLRSHMAEMLAIFRQTGWALHTIDIRGLRDQGADNTHDGLFQLARDSGGNFYRNNSNMTQAIGKVFKNTSHTYWLAFQPKNLQQDGRYHRIEVKLKGVRGRTRIQFQKRGYYAPLPNTP